MKRKTIHSGFTIITAALLVLTAIEGLALYRSLSIAESIRQIPASLSPDNISSLSDAPSDYAETRLAWANALSSSGNFEAAEPALNDLIQRQNSNATGQAALFNLGNAYLRQGMRDDLLASGKGPMLELAKQRYRDLLSTKPDDWDARHNLELALRLAPENGESVDDRIVPVKSVRVIVPDFKAKDLP